MGGDTFWYLASPYTRYEAGQDAANLLACQNAALLLRAGVPVFSPIAHSHALACLGGLSYVDHDFWINTVDRPMMRGAHGLIFLKADGWQNSKGMHEEIVHFVSGDRPVIFMEPGVVPTALRPAILGWSAPAPRDGVIYAAASQHQWSPMASEEQRLVREAIARCTP